ncbi:hypothetical protein ABES80_12285 [Bacillus gobiensis]|uniref:hypothetical protein n=1 Tax=Bacillus gobiensis TaxID=1441095 RepID=UPI003D23870B
MRNTDKRALVRELEYVNGKLSKLKNDRAVIETNIDILKNKKKRLEIDLQKLQDQTEEEDNRLYFGVNSPE